MLGCNRDEMSHCNKKEPDEDLNLLKSTPSFWTKLCLFVKDSRWGGIPLALLYGLYMYYLVAHMVLTNPSSSEMPTELKEQKVERYLYNRMNSRLSQFFWR